MQFFFFWKWLHILIFKSRKMCVCVRCDPIPRPVSLEEGRVVDDGGKEGREAPQKQGGEELSDDRALKEQTQGGGANTHEWQDRDWRTKPCALNKNAYIQILHRFGDVELVHGGDDDGGGGEEEEEDEEQTVDD